MKKISIFALAVAVSGCASIIDGKDQNINLVPSSGGKVSATVISPAGMQEVTLPTVIHTNRSNEDIVVNIEESSCYEESTQVIQSSVNPLILGNVITGGFLGSTTDFATGAAWEYDKNAVVFVNKKDTCGSVSKNKNSLNDVYEQ